MFGKTSALFLFSLAGALALPTTLPPSADAKSNVATREAWGYGYSSKVTQTYGLSWYSASLTRGAQGNAYSGYTCFAGDSASFPAHNQWLSFEDMWAANQPTMAYNDSPDEIASIKKAIKAVSNESKVDARLILAVVMQESAGNVNAPCTSDNCGLMQGPQGSTSYNPADSYNSILQMIRDGVFGTQASQTGYVFYIQDAPSMAYYNIQNPGNPYEAARCYNSGSISADGNLNEIAEWGTKAYVNDIANRLRGWNGDSVGCQAAVACGLRDAGECW